MMAATFRSQLGSDLSKDLYWWAETALEPKLSGAITRNSLLDEPSVKLSDTDPGRADIRHEYFVPPERFQEFIAHCQQVIPASYQQLLDATVRYVKADGESMLSYAPGPRLTVMLLFSQEKTVRAEADMARMTHHMNERVLSIGGSYYLPFRPHASIDQFQRAYPRAAEFVAGKRKADPDLTFRNRFWDNYLAKL